MYGLVQISLADDVRILEGDAPPQVCATITRLDDNMTIESSTVTTIDGTGTDKSNPTNYLSHF